MSKHNPNSVRFFSIPAHYLRNGRDYIKPTAVVLLKITGLRELLYNCETLKS